MKHFIILLIFLNCSLLIFAGQFDEDNDENYIIINTSEDISDIQGKNITNLKNTDITDKEKHDVSKVNIDFNNGADDKNIDKPKDTEYINAVEPEKETIEVNIDVKAEAESDIKNKETKEVEKLKGVKEEEREISIQEDQENAKKLKSMNPKQVSVYIFRRYCLKEDLELLKKGMNYQEITAKTFNNMLKDMKFYLKFSAIIDLQSIIDNFPKAKLKYIEMQNILLDEGALDFLEPDQVYKIKELNLYFVKSIFTRYIDKKKESEFYAEEGLDTNLIDISQVLNM